MAAAQEAVEFAIELGDQLSLCYVLATGACPVAAWTGDLDLLSKFVSIFRKTVDEQSLIYWDQWALTFEWGLKMKYDPAQSRFVDRQRFSTFAPLQHEVLVSLDPGLLTTEVLQRAHRNEAGFSLPEILRSQGVRLLEGTVDRGHAWQKTEGYFREALRVAKRNGSPAWALRAATSLLRLKLDSREVSEAVDLVDDILSTFTQGHHTRDLRLARQLLEASKLRQTASDRV